MKTRENRDGQMQWLNPVIKVGGWGSGFCHPEAYDGRMAHLRFYFYTFLKKGLFF